MSENGKKTKIQNNFSEPKVTYSNPIFCLNHCLKPKDRLLYLQLNKTEKEEIHILEKVENTESLA